MSRKSLTAVKSSMITGFAYGLSQFIIYATISIIFYAGVKFVQNNGENPEDIFMAIFSIMFASLEIGQSQQFGPDIGKARAAARKIFSILDYPSKQNSSLEGQENKKKIDKETF